MKKLSTLAAVALATLVVAGSAGADTKTVQITRQGFTPAATTIAVGDTVTWHNADTVSHQVVANDGSFASPALKAGETYSFTFQNAGRVNYHDSFATRKTGSVTANAPAAQVALDPATTTITYGDNTSLSGTISNQLTDESSR
jgi:plastocyanin